VKPVALPYIMVFLDTPCTVLSLNISSMLISSFSEPPRPIKRRRNRLLIEPGYCALMFVSWTTNWELVFRNKTSISLLCYLFHNIFGEQLTTIPKARFERKSNYNKSTLQVFSKSKKYSGEKDVNHINFIEQLLALCKQCFYIICKKRSSSVNLKSIRVRRM